LLWSFSLRTMVAVEFVDHMPSLVLAAATLAAALALYTRAVITPAIRAFA
jgi:hypothetical protein